MSLDAIVFWLFVAAWIVVGGLLAFVQLPRLVREAARAVSLVAGLVDKSTLPLAIAKAEADVSRLNAALDRLPEIAVRAVAVVDSIRKVPVIPPAIRELVARVKRELQDFRRALR